MNYDKTTSDGQTDQLTRFRMTDEKRSMETDCGCLHLTHPSAVVQNLVFQQNFCDFVVIAHDFLGFGTLDGRNGGK